MDYKNHQSIRRSIFRRELDYIWYEQNIPEPIQQRALETLFENPFLPGEQYLLVGSISNRKQLTDSLCNIFEKQDVQDKIVNIFIVESDLIIPSDLLKLFIEDSSRVAFFTGAGPSTALGYPNWNSLGDEAIKKLFKLNFINSFEFERIQERIKDPKQRLTIFQEICMAGGKYTSKKECKLYKEFYDHFFLGKDRKEINRKCNLYSTLVKFDTLKITTNIDNEFFSALSDYLTLSSDCGKDEYNDSTEKPKIANKSWHLPSPERLNTDTIYHIHGHIAEVDSLVMTTRDYVKAYYDEEKLGSFLRYIFNHYTVVFIGYGVSEFPILEHLVRGSRQHYVLLNSFLNEQNIIKMNQAYFNSINIQVIPYYTDFIGYDRLKEVFDVWLNTIEDRKSGSIFPKFNEMDAVGL